MARFANRVTARWNRQYPIATRTILILLAAVSITGLLTFPPIHSQSAAPSSVHLSPGSILLAQAQASLARGPSVVAPVAPHGPSSTMGTWLEVVKPTPTTPPARYLAMMVYDPADQYVLLFGGHNTTNDLGDSWSYSNAQWTQLNVGNAPSPRYLGGMVWDSVDGYVVLFGGHSLSTTTQSYNDTWTFLHGQWVDVTSNSVNAPSVRWRMGMAYDIADQYVLLFGGTDNLGSTAFHDTWKYAAGTWTNISSLVSGSPPGRYRAATAYDAADGYVLQFGGCVSTAVTTCQTSDVWKYHNLTWTQLTPATRPSARVYPGMTYDGAHGSMLLFGGSATPTGGPMRDTWSFLNGTWTNLSGLLTNQPTYRGFENMAFYAMGNYTLLFGGENDNSITWYGDTWSYGPAVIVAVTTTPSTLDLRQNTTFNVTAVSASSYLNYSYPTLPSGCTSANTSFLVCTPNSSGVFPVKINVSTPAGQNVTLQSVVRVNPDPQLVTFRVTPAAMTAGGPVAFAVNVTSGSAPYRYLYSGLPTGCTSRNVWNLSCRPSAMGSYSIQVAATDNASWVVYSNVTLQVNPRPILSGVVAQPSVLDVGQRTNITSTVSGGTLPIVFNYTGLPPGCVSSNVQRLACQPSSAGAYTVLVQATDAGGFGSLGTVNITVTDAPAIQSFKALPATVDAGQVVRFYLNASGGNGLLNYSYSGTVPGCILSRSPSPTCTPTGTGTFTVTGSVSDGVGSVVQASLLLTVNPDPTILAVNSSAPFIDVGQNLGITVWVSGGTAPYTFTYSGLPAGCSPVHTASFNCTPTQVGSPSITVVAADHWGKTAQSAVSVTINAAPALTSFTATPSPATRGQSFTLVASVTGGSGIYTFSYTSLPPGCSSSNTSSLHCTPTTTGLYTVSVRVVDTLAVSVTSSVVVAVQAPASSGDTFLGLPATTGYGVLLVIAVIVIVVVVAVALMLRRRGGGGTPPTSDAEYPVDDPAPGPPEDGQE